MRASLQGGCREEVRLRASRKANSLCKGPQWEGIMGPGEWTAGETVFMARGSGQGPWFLLTVK